MRTDLRELAKLAAPEPPASSGATAAGFATADSSGFVDLSAFSAAEDGANLDSWVERELARAGGKTKAGAELSAGSMAPVAMASLLGPERAAADARPRKRGWVYTAMGILGVAAVASLAVTLSRHAPQTTRTLPQSDVAAPAVAPPVAAAAPATSEAAVDTAPTGVASAAPVAVTASPLDPAPSSSSRKHAATRWHGAPAAAAAAAPAAVAKVSIPAAKSGGGGSDSLMDLMRASINSKKIF